MYTADVISAFSGVPGCSAKDYGGRVVFFRDRQQVCKASRVLPLFWKSDCAHHMNRKGIIVYRSAMSLLRGEELDIFEGRLHEAK